MSKAKGKGRARAATQAPDVAPEAAPATGLVTCRLGPRSTVGALQVGNARIEAKRAGRIPRGEFDRLQSEYDLQEVTE